MLQLFFAADKSTIFYIYLNVTYSELILPLESRFSSIKKFLSDVSGSFLCMFKVWAIHLFMKIGCDIVSVHSEMKKKTQSRAQYLYIVKQLTV